MGGYSDTGTLLRLIAPPQCGDQFSYSAESSTTQENNESIVALKNVKLNVKCTYETLECDRMVDPAERVFSPDTN